MHPIAAFRCQTSSPKGLRDAAAETTRSSAHIITACFLNRKLKLVWSYAVEEATASIIIIIINK